MRTTPCYAIALATLAMLGSSAQAALTPYWFDGFDTTGPTSDINADIATRQGGAPAPVTWTANSADPSNDYHHQMFGAGVLQVAGDTFLTSPPSVTPTRVSPTTNFKGTVGNEAIGRKVQVDMDAYFNNPLGGTFTFAAITAASSTTLADAQNKADGFSVSFVEDNFNDPLVNNTFLQFFDGNVLVGNLIPNPAGAGGGFVEIFFDDPTDGDPFDGVGDTLVGVAVNGTPVFNYVKSGGYTDNFITLEGGVQTNFGVPGAGLALHSFDNLTVFTGTLIPEPASAALAAFAASLLALRRRR